MKTLVRWALRIFPRPFLIRMSYLLMGLFKPFLAGNQVTCPVCGSSFRKFLPYGIRSRDNVLCPQCLSLERHRLIWLYLDRNGWFKKEGIRLLHVAPEQCFHKRFKKLAGWEYVTADLESPLADHHFDLHDIPFEPESYDMVMCNHVLEHVADDHRVMSEINRILRPGGLAIMQVPIDTDRPATYEDPAIVSPKQREIHFGQKDHVRFFGRDYPERLRKAGFTVKEWPVEGNFSTDEIGKYRLATDEVLYIATRSS
jgi:SAM-dependent methyltransferase